MATWRGELGNGRDGNVREYVICASIYLSISSSPLFLSAPLHLSLSLSLPLTRSLGLSPFYNSYHLVSTMPISMATAKVLQAGNLLLYVD